jgi:hypothetical protein
MHHLVMARRMSGYLPLFSQSFFLELEIHFREFCLVTSGLTDLPVSRCFKRMNTSKISRHTQRTKLSLR